MMLGSLSFHLNQFYLVNRLFCLHTHYSLLKTIIVHKSESRKFVDLANQKVYASNTGSNNETINNSSVIGETNKLRKGYKPNYLIGRYCKTLNNVALKIDRILKHFNFATEKKTLQLKRVREEDVIRFFTFISRAGFSNHNTFSLKLTENLFSQLKISGATLSPEYFSFLLQEYAEFGLLNKLDALFEEASKTNIQVDLTKIYLLRMKCSVVLNDLEAIRSNFENLRNHSVDDISKPYMRLLLFLNRTSKPSPIFEETFKDLKQTLSSLGRPLPTFACNALFVHLQNTHQYHRIVELSSTNRNFRLPPLLLANAYIETQHYNMAYRVLAEFIIKEKKTPYYFLKLASFVPTQYEQILNAATRTVGRFKKLYLATAFMKSLYTDSPAVLLRTIQDPAKLHLGHQMTKLELLDELKVSFAAICNAEAVKLFHSAKPNYNTEFLVELIMSPLTDVNKDMWAADPNIEFVQFRNRKLVDLKFRANARVAVDLLKFFETELKINCTNAYMATCKELFSETAKRIYSFGFDDMVDEVFELMIKSGLKFSINEAEVLYLTFGVNTDKVIPINIVDKNDNVKKV
ncbi:hypothetical protein HK096_005211 [Nowakowskiella sp. JEL0078]|nr:hypothetical protein HK096_005211 [Nowakowskiella sp. JEL0078]